MAAASEEIQSAVLGWKDVTIHPHRFGGIEFRFGRRELGHLHGESLLDIPFPRRVKEELIAAGKAQKHHILPESGWISYRIRSHQDVVQAVALLQRSYELAINSRNRKGRETQATTSEGHEE